MFVCPQSFYMMINSLESLGEQGLLHGWSDVVTCIRLQEDANDLKFFSHDPHMLEKIYGENIPSGNESSVLKNVFDKLKTKDVRQCSLKDGKFEFVMFDVECESMKMNNVVQVQCTY